MKSLKELLAGRALPVAVTCIYPQCMCSLMVVQRMGDVYLCNNGEHVHESSREFELLAADPNHPSSDAVTLAEMAEAIQPGRINWTAVADELAAPAQCSCAIVALMQMGCKCGGK